MVKALLVFTGARTLAVRSLGLFLTWDRPESLDAHCLWMLRTSHSPAQATGVLRDLTLKHG